MERRKVTILGLQAKKNRGEPITMLTAYDYPMALAVDQAGVDVILVGDSVAMVELGYTSTVPVTMDEMLHHCRAVSRGAKAAFLVGDMPFLSYQADRVEAVRNAGRFLKEAGMDAIKLEGGKEVADTARAIVNAGIPVMGHIGLTPQSISLLSGYRVQGRTAADARSLLEDALALQAAGCFSIVLEMVPDRVAEVISRQLRIPTIGIGAGVGCDGQVLVSHDLLGLFDRFTPRFVRQYANLREQMVQAFARYHQDVKARAFPANEHAFSIEDAEFEQFAASIPGYEPARPAAHRNGHTQPESALPNPEAPTYGAAPQEG